MKVTLYFLLASLFVGNAVFSQTLGGDAVFNFLRFPATPQLTALGGVNVSATSNDVGLAFNNPSLLRKEMHTQLNSVFNSFYGGINSYNLNFGFRNEKLKTNFAGGLQYFDYGKIVETDASGNQLGMIKPTDWVIQISASHHYLKKWNYGTTLKFISSNYGLYRSSGVAMDIGVLFHDSLFAASVVVKNVGFQLKKYTGTLSEELPFDVQAGVTKKLRDAPISFSLTAQRLHQFDINYNDTVFNNLYGINNQSSFVQQLFNHLILAAQFYPTSSIELSMGYNHLRRNELNVANATNGLNGFSMGVGVLLKKINFRYALAYYQNNTTYSQFGLNIKLNEYFGFGKFGERIFW